MSFIVLPEYKKAINSIINNPVTFLSGPAGSGKSTFIRYIRSKIENSILMAPTGIAAINIKGRTIHSVLKIPPKFIISEDIRRLNADERKFLKATSLIIIDETSMVSSNLMDAIDESLRKNTGVDKPFGGIHILLVGDLFQLPPIVGNDIEKIYYEFYDSPMFYDSSIIKSLIESKQFEFIRLNNVLRQKDNHFIDILNNIRVGNKVNASIDLLNSLVDYKKVAPKGYVQITPYNEVSEVTNNRNLAAIDSPLKTYFGKVCGKFNSNNFPVPQSLSLKVGAQVMITKNLSKSVVNGTVGTIKKLCEDHIYVYTNDGDDVKIEFVTWEERGYSIEDGKYKSSIVGTYSQLPIKLAWSMTIHKVQSATIQKLYIDMDKGAFAPGMLYVALSRAVSLDGLILSKPLLYDDVIVDSSVLDFYNRF